MPRFVETLLKWVALGVLGLVCMVLVALIALWMEINSEVERKIRLALQSKYPGREVSIRAEDRGPMRQRCYEIDVTDRAMGTISRKVAKILGDSDGGSWAFGGEFPSLDHCKASHSIG